MSPLLKFYNLTMILAVVVCIFGGIFKSEALFATASAMVAAAGTSYQAEAQSAQSDAKGAKAPEV